MKKATTVALAGLMAVSSIASASMARKAGLGAAEEFVTDVQNIWTLPGELANNGNVMYLEFGKSSVDANTAATTVSQLPNNTWGGAHVGLGGGVLGVWVGRPANELSTAYGLAVNVGSSWGAGSTLDTLLNTSFPNTFGFLGESGSTLNTLAGPGDRVDVLYGWNLSDKAAVGVGLNRANRSANAKQTGGNEQNYDASNYGVNLGADLKDLGAINLLEVGVQFNMESQGVSSKGTGFENKYGTSGNAINVRAGADIDSYRAEVKFGTQSLSVKDEPQGGPVTEEKVSVMSWGAGLAMIKSGNKGLGLGGLTLSGGNNSDEITGSTMKNSNLKLGYVAAAEGKVKEWLTARAGVAGTIYGNNGTDNGTGTTTSNSTPAGAKLSAGLGLTFGDLVIDGALNQNLLYTGGWLVSGVANSLFSQVSATWSFGGGKE